MLLLPSLTGCNNVWYLFLQLSILQKSLDLQLFTMWEFKRQLKHNLLTFTNLRCFTSWLHSAIYDPWNKASIEIYSSDNSTYLLPMQETCGRDFCYLFLRDVNLSKNPFFVFFFDGPKSNFDCC